MVRFLQYALLAIVTVVAQETITIPRNVVGTAPPLPPGTPQPPPPYMRDNRNNYFGTAPDKGSLELPVLAPLGAEALSLIHKQNLSLIPREDDIQQSADDWLPATQLDRRQSSDSYWLSSAGSAGKMPFAPSGYQFFRNVKDFGAKGDGVTDDTAAINRAAATYGLTNLNKLRCGRECGSTTALGAVVYFPKGTYLVSTPIIQYYYTQFVGHPTDMPTMKSTKNFTGIAIFDSDVYIPGGNGAEWYINQSNFYRQIRNFNFDMTGQNWTNKDNGQTYVPSGIHWQVGQATSITNCNFKMSVSEPGQPATGVGIYMENGSGGSVSDLYFFGGNIGFLAGSQQFTARNLKFESCLTAIFQQWNWGFTWKNIYVLSCYIAIDATSYSGITNQGTGSVSVLDSHFNYVPYAITMNSRGDQQPNIVLENLLVEKSQSIVLISGGATILAGSDAPVYIDSWASGYQYLPNGFSGKRTGYMTVKPNKPRALLDGDGAWFSRSKPQYAGQTVLSATQNGVANDATGDQTNAINTLLQNNVGKVIFFPGGVYLVKGTVFIPRGSKIIGSGWSQIMGTGSYFQDASNPKVMVRVGNAGDSGIIEITDMMFTVQGPTAGAILMEWNVHESTQGSAAMWDSHFRVGGAVGTNLQMANCKVGSASTANCKAAFMLMRITTRASGYFDNVWLWIADHDLDNTLNADATEGPDGIPQNVKTNIAIYVGRGLLVESQGPTWFYGSSSEHATLYQYQLQNAANIFMSHIQTETPYYQPNPNALSPYEPGGLTTDPTFRNCADDLCKSAWALRVINSTDVYIYSAGFYSFFRNNQLGCAPQERCQLSMIDTNYASKFWIYNIFTKGNIQIVTPQGGLPPLLFNSTTRNGYTSEIAAWLALSGGSVIGSNNTSNSSSSDVVTIDPDVWIGTTSKTVNCYPPCTYVWPPLTLSTPTTFVYPPLTTNMTVGYYSTYTRTITSSATVTSVWLISTFRTTITIPPITTSVISWFDNTVTGTSEIVILTPSVTQTSFIITDPTSFSSTTITRGTRTFYPPPWIGTTVPPEYTGSRSPSSSQGGTRTTPPGGTGVNHSGGPPRPTCTRIAGCGSRCNPLLQSCSRCWLFCGGPPGTNGQDPDQPGGISIPGGPGGPGNNPSSTSTECQSSTFSSCSTSCNAGASTSSCSTSCRNVVGCQEPTGTSTCVYPTATNEYRGDGSEANPPIIGSGDLYNGYVAVPAKQTQIRFTSTAPPPRTTTTTTITSTISRTTTTTTRTVTTTAPGTPPKPPRAAPTFTKLDQKPAACYDDPSQNTIAGQAFEDYVGDFCGSSYTLRANAAPGSNGAIYYGNPATFAFYLSLNWADDQTGCSAKADYVVGNDGVVCFAAYKQIIYESCINSGAGDTKGGEFISKFDNRGGCIIWRAYTNS